MLEMRTTSQLRVLAGAALFVCAAAGLAAQAPPTRAASAPGAIVPSPSPSPEDPPCDDPQSLRSPDTCLPMLTLSAGQVTKELYVAAAVVTDRTELDVVAGALAEQAALTPNATATQLRTAMNQLHALLLSHAPHPAYDLTGTPERRVSRLLGRVVPVLPASSREATRAYARSYSIALRAGLDQTRALTRLETLYDRQGEYDTFRRGEWGRFIDAVRARPALATVVNEPASPFVQTLGLRTTDTATVMMDARDVEPLEAFVRAHLQPDGSTVASRTEVDSLVGEAGHAATELARRYADNLYAVNEAQEAYLRANAGPMPMAMAAGSDPKTELENAIASAKAIQTGLDGTLKKVRGGASGTLGFLSAWLKFAGFQSDARDVEKVAKAVTTIIDGISKYTQGAISMAERVGKISGGSVATLVGSAVLTGGLASVALDVISIFGSGAPDRMTQVLQTLREIREIVSEMKVQMHARFDRIDDKLNRMLDTILEYFALVDWEIGETQAQVAEVQAGLYEVQSDLSRLERNVYIFMSALSHQPLMASITGNLRYRERTQVDMPYIPTYENAENDFYVWARELSKDDLLGGPQQRSFSDDSLLAELTAFPLATNINYLSQFPQVRLGLPALSTTRLSNPLDWGVAAESYAQLSEEWPEHALLIAQYRLADARDSGQKLATALNAIASVPLFVKLSEHYQASFAAVKARIGELEAAYEVDATNRLYGVDLWGGPNQVPNQSLLSQTLDLPSCTGRPFGQLPTLRFDFRHADYLPYGALMLGHNLGAGTAWACIDGDWALYSAQPTGLGGTWRYTYRLNVVVRVHYDSTRVLNHTFQTTRQRIHQRLPTVPFNPNAAWPSEADVAAEWPAVRNKPAFVNLAATASFMDQVRAGVTAQLLLRQRDFYTRVALRCRETGSALHSAVRTLSGSKTLWESYVTLGLPTALEQSDYLRSLLFGSGALFTGSDIGDDDGLLNDVEDVYTYTAGQATLPAQNVMAGLDPLQAERSRNLRDELARIVNAMNSASEHEGEVLVRSTLTRLSIVPQAPPLP
jgi:hypothetical protein